MPQGTATSLPDPRPKSMDPKSLQELLEQVKDGAVSPEEAAARLATLPYEDLGFAKVDHHRALRRGFPEVVFGPARRPSRSPRSSSGSPPGASASWSRGRTPRCTAVAAVRPEARFHAAARCLTVETAPAPALPGSIAVCAAGTSDLPVAEEAAVTGALHGADVERDLRRRRGRPAPPADRTETSSAGRRGRRRGRHGGGAALGGRRPGRRARSSPCPPASATAPVSAAWPRCWPCSTPAPRAWRGEHRQRLRGGASRVPDPAPPCRRPCSRPAAAP